MPWLFLVICISIWILESAHSLWQKKKKPYCVFNRDYVKHLDQFGKTCYPNNIESPICGHGSTTQMSLHWFKFSSNYFTTILQFQYPTLHFFLKFSPKYLIFQILLWMRFSPLVSFFNCMYTIWKCNLFFTFILYLKTLLNPLIGSSSSVCVCVCVRVFLRLFYIELLLGNKDGSSSLPMWIPFIYFPCLTVLAGTASRILKRRGDTGHPALFLILGGINVCLFTIMLVIAIGFL